MCIRDRAAGEPVFQPYALLDYGDTTVGYVGICTPESLTKTDPTYFRDEAGEAVYGFRQGGDGQELDVYKRQELAEIVYTSRSVMDLTEIASVILGTAEFSLNGEPLGEVQMKEQLYPCLLYTSRWSVR